MAHRSLLLLLLFSPLLLALETCSPLDFEAKCLDASCGVPLDTVLSSSLACECAEDDIGYMMTPCAQELHGMKHDLIYFWRPPATCLPPANKTVVLPQPIRDVPCDLVCPAGTFINTTVLKAIIQDEQQGTARRSQDACQICPPGTRSDGTGQKWEVWQNFLPGQFSSHCTAGNSQHSCQPWRLLGDTIDSGINVHDYLLSSLDLNVNLVRPGNVSFVYKVSAQGRADGLRFSIDDLRMLSVANSRTWANYTTNLDAGFHQLKWYYYKDHGITAGEDRASIRWIEVTGISYGDLECEPCPPGFFNPSPGSADCQECPEGTITAPNAWGSTSCTPCPAGQFSFPGSVSCLSRYSCTKADITSYLTPCKNGKQDRKYTWIEPKVCNDAAADSEVLPIPVANLPCEVKCKPGEFWSSNGQECKPCHQGSYTDGSSAKPTSCKSCPAGQTTSAPVAVLNSFITWPQYQLSTTCTPANECSTGGWRLANTFIDSGVGNGMHSVSSLLLHVEMVTPGHLDIDYRLDCDPATTNYFSVELNDLVFAMIPCSSMVHSCAPVPVYGENEQYSHLRIPLSEDRHRIRFSYAKNGTSTSHLPCERVTIRSMAVTGLSFFHGISDKCEECPPGYFTPAAGLASCTKCPAGTYSYSKGSISCSVCPDDTYSEEGWTACLQCGQRTHMNDQHTGCEYSCKSIVLKEQDQNSVYDLSPLAGPDGNMHGPFFEPTLHPNGSFYLSLCDRHDSERVCDVNVLHHSHLRNVYERDEGDFNDFGEAGEYHSEREMERREIEKRVIYHPPFSCVTYPNGSVISLGTVIGFSETKEPGSTGVQMTYDHGDKGCHTIVDVVCDTTAGRGEPALVEYRPDPFDCEYHWVWRSLYGCRYCRAEDLMKYPAGPCKGGKRVIGYSVKPERTALCRLHSAGLPANTTEHCTENAVEISHTALILSILGGVLVALFLLIAVVVAIWFWRKHRTLEYRYTQLSLSTGDIPMTASKFSDQLQVYSLEEENEGQGETAEGTEEGQSIETEEKNKQNI